MDEQEALKIVNEAIFETEKRKLKDIEKFIFKGALQNNTYKKIAEDNNYDEQHVKNQGADFWKILSKALGEKVGKNNFLAALERRRSPDATKTQYFHKSNNLEEKINDLVDKVRLNIREIILDKCGTMKVLDMTQSIGLNDIYTNVNILKKITSRIRKDISQIQKEYNAKNFERFEIGDAIQERIPGIEIVKRYSKLMVLGKPGSGKTTFLKYLAIQCIDGDFLKHIVPIFITLRQFAEAENQPNLLEYITHFFSDDTVSSLEIDSIFKNGKALILLDGLDEVREADNNRLLKQILHFSTQYSKNKFVITCRIAAREYDFEKFTDVEVADFDNEQINNFANNWFKFKNPDIGNKFISKLEENPPVKELATNPLLLTLLCLEFEDYLDFPTNRSELYERGVGVLLNKWDAKRGIERDQVYKRLSLRRKEDLLSQVAVKTFERGDYLFKERELKENIRLYIENLPDAKTDSEALLIDSEAVLKSIESQHGLFVERARGIYSFSHLTFHEYFTARGIYTSLDSLKNLVNHITETPWREVFLLVAGMLPNADEFLLLMKEKIDNLLAQDEKMQFFLEWLKQIVSDDSDFTLLQFRAFYLCLEYVHNFGIFTAEEVVELGDFFGICYIDETCEFALDLSIPANLRKINEIEIDNLLIDQKLYELIDFCMNGSFYPNNFANEIDDLTKENIDLNLISELKKLKDELPDENQAEQQLNPRFDNSLDTWWKTHSKNWAEKLRNVIIEHRDIGHNWQFISSQIELLQKYYDANVILIECLRSDCFVTREVRNKIQDELFLPITEIEKRKE